MKAMGCQSLSESNWVVSCQLPLLMHQIQFGTVLIGQASTKLVLPYIVSLEYQTHFGILLPI
jgi:hypothetical protein